MSGLKEETRSKGYDRRRGAPTGPAQEPGGRNT